jgi:hypothetical protein
MRGRLGGDLFTVVIIPLTAVLLGVLLVVLVTQL